MTKVTPLNVPDKFRVDELVDKIVQLLDCPMLSDDDGKFSAEQEAEWEKSDETAVSVVAKVITALSFDIPNVLARISSLTKDFYDCSFTRSAPRPSNVTPLHPPEDYP